MCSCSSLFFFFQAEDGIRDLVRSRGLGDVYKRQDQYFGVFVRCPGSQQELADVLQHRGAEGRLGQARFPHDLARDMGARHRVRLQSVEVETADGPSRSILLDDGRAEHEGLDRVESQVRDGPCLL